MVDVYSDADFANGVSLKSVSDMVLIMYGKCVFWRSKSRMSGCGALVALV